MKNPEILSMEKKFIMITLKKLTWIAFIKVLCSNIAYHREYLYNLYKSALKVTLHLDIIYLYKTSQNAI